MKTVIGIFLAASVSIAASSANAQVKNTTKTTVKKTVTTTTPATTTTKTTTVVKKDTVVKRRIIKHYKARPKASQKEETIEIANSDGATVIEVNDGKTYINGELISSDNQKGKKKIIINNKEKEEKLERSNPIPEDEYVDHSRRTVLGVLTDQYGDYDGAHVSSVVRNSPADEAGLLPGDLIIRINGREIRDSRDLVSAINDHDGGERIMITYDRRGRILHAEAELAETSLGHRNQTYEYTVPDLHGNRRIPGPFLNAYTYNTVDNYFDYTPQMGITAEGARNGRGVAILDVKANSPADYAGLQNGDVLIRLDHLRVTTVGDIQDILDDTWPNQKVAIEFKRDGVIMYTYMRFTKEKTRKEL